MSIQKCISQWCKQVSKRQQWHKALFLPSKSKNNTKKEKKRLELSGLFLNTKNKNTNSTERLDEAGKVIDWKQIRATKNRCYSEISRLHSIYRRIGKAHRKLRVTSYRTMIATIHVDKKGEDTKLSVELETRVKVHVWKAMVLYSKDYVKCIGMIRLNKNKDIQQFC